MLTIHDDSRFGRRDFLRIGSLALGGIGIPHVFGLSGFYSKDIILEAAWAAGTGVGRYSFALGIIAAFLTAFYSWRLIFLTFHGKPRADAETMHHVHESPWVMILPLFVLAAGAIFAGVLGYHEFVGEGRDDFWHGSIVVAAEHASLEAAHHAPEWVSELPLLVGLVGIAAAWIAYIWRPEIPAMAAGRFRALYLFLLNKWYFDELYDALFVRPSLALGQWLWQRGDAGTIDRLGPDGLALTTSRLSVRASLLQTGYLYHYAFVMLIGVVLLISWYLLQQIG